MNQEFDDQDTPSEADLDLCYGSKTLSATELGDRKIRTRIRKVRKALLRGQDGKEKNKFVLSFSNLDKGLVANPTNIKTLVDALGKAPSGWLNAEVGLFTEPTMMAGKPTRGVRLRVLGKPPSAAPAPAPLRSRRPPRRLPRMPRRGLTNPATRDRRMTSSISERGRSDLLRAAPPLRCRPSLVKGSAR
jgi:hypothetical protein